MSDEFTLKKLRALCLDIHDEQSAILLRSCLAEFPIPVINEFFTGPKLNKPSNGEEREWTDIVRLTLIALAPEGSEPAKLRGTPFGRYVNSYPYEPNRNDADTIGLLTLRRTSHTSPLLKDIATGLGIQTLKIQSEKWLECYLANPFPIKSLEIYIDLPSLNTKPNPDSLPYLQEDFSLALDLLPDSLEHLSLEFGDFPKFPKLNGHSISRFSALTKLSLEIDSLPEGIDFSKNSQLESITLELKKGGAKPIVGIGKLKKLKSLKICSNNSIPLESIAPHFKKTTDSINIAGVHYLVAEICGESPQTLELGGISGLRKVKLHANSDKKCELEIGNSYLPIELETLEVSGRFQRIDVENCPHLLTLKSDIRCECSEYRIENCDLLNKIDAVFSENIEDFSLINLPALSEASIKAPSGCQGVGSSIKCIFVNIGARQLPVFKGAWRGFSRIEISNCPSLESLAGLHVLPDLRLIQLKNLPAMQSLLPSGSPALSALSHLHAENVRVLAPAGFESMPALSKLEWIDCSLESMEGVESLQVLEGVDLTGSDLRSIAPFASSPRLRSIRVSKCEMLKPKPPRVLLEGDVLASELSRATGGKVTTGARGEFLKVVELLSSGSIDDINQAVHFISILADEERKLLLTGAGINPETGWIRLPFLTKLKDEESQGLSQFRIIHALRDVEPTAARILESVDTIILNPAEQTTGALCFGKVIYPSKNDKILEEFPSLAALPTLKNITKIFVRQLSHFSLQGIANFPALESLEILGVDRIGDINCLDGHAHLKNLELATPDIHDLHEIGHLPALRTLSCSRDFKNLCGIENFPALRQLQTGSIEDLSKLFAFAKKHQKIIAYKQELRSFELV